MTHDKIQSWDDLVKSMDEENRAKYARQSVGGLVKPGRRIRTRRKLKRV